MSYAIMHIPSALFVIDSRSVLEGLSYKLQISLYAADTSESFPIVRSDCKKDLYIYLETHNIYFICKDTATGVMLMDGYFGDDLGKSLRIDQFEIVEIADV